MNTLYIAASTYYLVYLKFVSDSDPVLSYDTDGDVWQDGDQQHHHRHYPRGGQGDDVVVDPVGGGVQGRILGPFGVGEEVEEAGR